MWLLVAAGGAAGSTVAALLLRRPAHTRPLVATATLCALMGALTAQLHSAGVTALVGYGALGSAASMVALSTASPTWIGGDTPIRSTFAVTKRLAVYCAVAVSFALLGYLAVRGGYTLYKKLG